MVRHRRIQRGRDRQGLIVHVDQLDRVLSERLRPGHDDSDGLADVAYDMASERWMRHGVEDRAGASSGRQIVQTQFGRTEGGDHTVGAPGSREVD